MGPSRVAQAGLLSFSGISRTGSLDPLGAPISVPTWSLGLEQEGFHLVGAGLSGKWSTERSGGGRCLAQLGLPRFVQEQWSHNALLLSSTLLLSDTSLILSVM